ncbi:hypothetical protein D3C81_1730320 [compost metagenome]
MITSDRQLPWRAANVSRALRVMAASYSSFSLLLSYRASYRAARSFLLRASRRTCVRTYWRMGSSMAKTWLASMAAAGAKSLSLKMGGRLAGGATLQAAKTQQSRAAPRCLKQGAETR